MFQIHQHEIEALAATLSLDLSDAEKVAILAATESCDIQAGPGSGKTTMLIAKLALLAPKWNSVDTGICVLSHTNVARREIENRIAHSASLRKFLHYPHFIGTFQRFVNEYLAMPYLRKHGVHIGAIDDEKFGSKASDLLGKPQFSVARAFLRNKYGNIPGKTDEIVGSLRFEGANLAIVHSLTGEKGAPGADSKTGKALVTLKESMMKYGYFRYDDMFAFAEAVLFECPYLADILRRRFPWVFVDELQDTSESQDRIVEQLFAVPECVLQRFGDKNQSIFQRNADKVEQPELFGRRRSFPLSTSHRFGGQIASFASALTVVQAQTLVGCTNKQPQNHSIFVFKRDSIQRVIPAFADLVLHEIPSQILDTGKCCVVGSRKNYQGDSQKFPLSLGHYWSGYKSDLDRKPRVPDSLVAYILSALASVAVESSYDEATSIALSGVLEFVRRADPSSATLPKNRTELQDVLKRHECWLALKVQLWGLLKPGMALNEQLWNEFVRQMRGLLKPVLPESLSRDALTFVQWSPPASETGQFEKGPVNSNVFVHTTAHSTLNLHVDSIHAVKGETHLATLVVETFMMRTHDIKSLLPVLTGKKACSTLAGGAIEHCKRVFVGLTRPSELVCMAIYADHLGNGDAKRLEKAGWSIKEL